jgi:hypothetical protein
MRAREILSLLATLAIGAAILVGFLTWDDEDGLPETPKASIDQNKGGAAPYDTQASPDGGGPPGAAVEMKND